MTGNTWPSHCTRQSFLSTQSAGSTQITKALFPERQCFVFYYIALPFGLSSSCRTFNDLVTTRMGFLHRCPLNGESTRVSSYIDDVLGSSLTFDSVSGRHMLGECTNKCALTIPLGNAIVFTDGV